MRAWCPTRWRSRANGFKGKRHGIPATSRRPLAWRGTTAPARATGSSLNRSGHLTLCALRAARMSKRPLFTLHFALSRRRSLTVAALKTAWRPWRAFPPRRGVRPSSGAATRERPSAPVLFERFGSWDVAVAGDGHTPAARAPVAGGFHRVPTVRQRCPFLISRVPDRCRSASSGGSLSGGSFRPQITQMHVDGDRTGRRSGAWYRREVSCIGPSSIGRWALDVVFCLANAQRSTLNAQRPAKWGLAAKMRYYVLVNSFVSDERRQRSNSEFL